MHARGTWFDCGLLNTIVFPSSFYSFSPAARMLDYDALLSTSTDAAAETHQIFFTAKPFVIVNDNTVPLLPVTTPIWQQDKPACM
jgi:hypothetical protein